MQRIVGVLRGVGESVLLGMLLVFVGMLVVVFKLRHGSPSLTRRAL